MGNSADDENFALSSFDNELWSKINQVINQNRAYLKKESTNSYLLNTCKSSSPSPTPIYFTGI